MNISSGATKTFSMRGGGPLIIIKYCNLFRNMNTPIMSGIRIKNAY